LLFILDVQTPKVGRSNTDPVNVVTVQMQMMIDEQVRAVPDSQKCGQDKYRGYDPFNYHFIHAPSP
jgi:hypothetical protein